MIWFFSSFAVINAENAAHRCEKFIAMATRTRTEYLKDLAQNHVTTTTLDSGSKLSMLKKLCLMFLILFYHPFPSLSLKFQNDPPPQKKSQKKQQQTGLTQKKNKIKAFF